MESKDELVGRLRERIKSLEDIADLAHHDIDRIYSANEQFLRVLVELLDQGHIAEAKAKIRWFLSRVAP